MAFFIMVETFFFTIEKKVVILRPEKYERKTLDN